jgi:hypothetical protein
MLSFNLQGESVLMQGVYSVPHNSFPFDSRAFFFRHSGLDPESHIADSCQADFACPFLSCFSKLFHIYIRAPGDGTLFATFDHSHIRGSEPA